MEGSIGSCINAIILGIEWLSKVEVKMRGIQRRVVVAAVAVLVAMLAVFIYCRICGLSVAEVRSALRADDERSAADDSRKVRHGRHDRDSGSAYGAGATDGEIDEDVQSSDEDESVADAVETFDALTDAWREPVGRPITLEEIQRFSRQFKNVPLESRDDCINRALNLIPDENVMLLAGILMDKSNGKELLDTVCSDLLNRDESVKMPILRQILKDRSHPCWADAAWVLDVTGELSGQDAPEKQ